MRRLLTVSAIWFLCLDGAVIAQPAFRPGPSGAAVAPVNNPAVSPYLNLLRPGTNPAINYFGLVKPIVDYNSSINNLQQQVSDVASPSTGMGGMEQNVLITGSSRPMKTVIDP